jgi:hypothetical protein
LFSSRSQTTVLKSAEGRKQPCFSAFAKYQLPNSGIENC